MSGAFEPFCPICYDEHDHETDCVQAMGERFAIRHHELSEELAPQFGLMTNRPAIAWGELTPDERAYRIEVAKTGVVPWLDWDAVRRERHAILKAATEILAKYRTDEYAATGLEEFLQWLRDRKAVEQAPRPGGDGDAEQQPGAGADDGSRGERPGSSAPHGDLTGESP